ncbi:hypothetical protein NIIDNTM18_09950 [Mycolicibacterium litorale]|uniref:DUF6418 domain-containing protein n=1 Tax=Mycolicibacterium litorale TaxID=758802 RepID=A0A6S6P2X7_9MYCO|nr:DUF6418 domain-containing protein [Mycolicibacterium litorale]BCI51717.1 hypothetical protein NIIDNTM18_09950 [Mycolicibacterium litorale]
MTFWEVAPALIVFFVGAGLYIKICLHFPPALVLGIVAYSMISKSASVAYLESAEVYLIEVDMVSHLVGATPRLIFYNLFIFAIAISIIRWIIAWQRPAIATRLANFGTAAYNGELRLALLISSALLVVQVMNALASPPYALPGSDINRQQFWANIRFAPIADMVGVLAIFVPAIAGAALAYGTVTNQRYFRRFSITLMLVYGVFFILTGARFHGPLMALLFWLSSYWIVLWAFGRKLYVKRMGLWLTVAVTAFLVVGYFEIADRGITEMTGSAWDGMLYRVFALQGNVSFAADVLTGEGESHSAALLLGDMATTLQAYMPTGLAQAYLDKGVNLAGSLPGNSIFVFGYWFGLIPMAIYAVLLGLIAGAYVYIILSGHFVLILPSSYLCLWAYTGYTQGSFAPFLDYKLLLFVGLIIGWLAFARSARHRQRPVRPHTSSATEVRS